MQRASELSSCQKQEDRNVKRGRELSRCARKSSHVRATTLPTKSGFLTQSLCKVVNADTHRLFNVVNTNRFQCRCCGKTSACPASTPRGATASMPTASSMSPCANSDRPIRRASSPRIPPTSGWGASGSGPSQGCLRSGCVCSITTAVGPSRRWMAGFAGCSMSACIRRVSALRSSMCHGDTTVT